MWGCHNHMDSCRNAAWGLNSPRVVNCLLTAVREGLIDALISGPHCATWSRARWHSLGGFARPLRGRSSHAWGLPHLPSHEQLRLRDANNCMLNPLAVAEGISEREGVHVIEHPEDSGAEP